MDIEEFSNIILRPGSLTGPQCHPIVSVLRREPFVGVSESWVYLHPLLLNVKYSLFQCKPYGISKESVACSPKCSCLFYIFTSALCDATVFFFSFLSIAGLIRVVCFKCPGSAIAHRPVLQSTAAAWFHSVTRSPLLGVLGVSVWSLAALCLVSWCAGLQQWLRTTVLPPFTSHVAV